MYDHVCMPNHANAFAQQQVSDMWHIQVSGAGAALAAMKDVEKVKDLEEKICKSVVTTKNMFFFSIANHRIFGISNVNPHERLLLLEMQLQMCSIQVCCLKPSEQTVQIDIQTFQTCSATMIISLQGRDWIGLPPDENREHLHRPGTSNHLELAPYVCLRKGREFRRLRESWSENKTHTAVQNIRRDSPRTGDNLQIFTGSIGFNASLLQEAWTFAPQIDMRVIRHILRYPQRSGSRDGDQFCHVFSQIRHFSSCFIIFSPFDVHVWSFLSSPQCSPACCSWTTDRRRPATWQSSSTWGERSNLQGVTQLMRSGDDWQWKNPAELPFRLNKYGYGESPFIDRWFTFDKWWFSIANC